MLVGSEDDVLDVSPLGPKEGKSPGISDGMSLSIVLVRELG